MDRGREFFIERGNEMRTEAKLKMIAENKALREQVKKCVAMLETIDGWMRQIGCKDNIVSILLAEMKVESNG